MINVQPANALAFTLDDLDARTFERLPKGSKAAEALEVLPLCAMSVAYLTEYCATNPKQPDERALVDRPDHSFALAFPLDAAGVKWIEQYLAEEVSPSVTKWSARHQPIKFKKRQDPTHQLYIAGLLWGQCLAQEFNLQWIENAHDAHRPLLVPARGAEPVPDINPWIKVCAFAHLGEEESLVSYISAMRNHSETTKLVRRLDEWIKSNLDQSLMMRVHRRQHWHDADGALQAVVLMDKSGVPLLRVVPQDIVNLTVAQGTPAAQH